MTLLFGFCSALALSMASMPLILKFAHSRKLYDSPNARKIHSGNIPRLGGLGIFASFAASLLLTAALTGIGFDESRWIWTVLGCMIIVFTVGLIDDFQDIRARFKLILELTAAMILITQGFAFFQIRLPFGLGTLPLGTAGYILTFFWIVGITNSINLIDGMDCLAGAIASLVAVTCGVFFLIKGNHEAALICIALFGAILGFLFYNRPPARIFMGDSGALFLGFSLSALPLIGPALGRVEIGIIPAITLLIIPVFDTLTAIIRRLRSKVSIFQPDKLHLHHKLLDLGLSTYGALAAVIAAQVLLCLVALSYLAFPIDVCFPLNVGIWIAYAALFAVVERAAARRREQAGKQIISILRDVEKEKFARLGVPLAVKEARSAGARGK
jgi:UDP-GlcNAc:undecaprenyl-phosphate/decaprenyl-phosphate GlcNAc-1-phosphate transferase